MNISPSIDLIWRLAAEEMVAGQFKEIQPEHFCMALLKFAELPPERLGESDLDVNLAKMLAEDIQLVKEAVQKCGIESTRARRGLRKQLGRGDTPHRGGGVHRSAASRALFEAAAVLAKESDSDSVTPLHLLTAMVQSPTPAISEIVLAKKAAAVGSVNSPLLNKHGRDLVREAVEGKLQVKPGAEAHRKAVLRALSQDSRKSVLLVADNGDLVDNVIAAIALTLSGKEAPKELRGRRLIDITESEWLGGQPGRRMANFEERTNLERLKQLFTEAGSNPEVILLVPRVQAGPKATGGNGWTNLLRNVMEKGKVQFIAQVDPIMFEDDLCTDPVWKRQSQAIWLKALPKKSSPREL